MDAERIRLIARKLPCGCIVGCISFLPDGESFARREIAQWEAKGYQVEESDDPAIHQQFVGESGCPHKGPEPEQLRLF